MDIHSNILVHWTGKDIDGGKSATRSADYTRRLADYYRNGLFSKLATEATLRGKKIKRLVRLCFTEIKLSQAQTHASRYGSMGIGFSRDFILNKGGRPVIYIPHQANNCLLEDSMRHIYDATQGDEVAHRNAKRLLTFVKRMSNEDGTENYFEEMEWRLVYDEEPIGSVFSKTSSPEIFRVPFQPSDVRTIVFPDEETKQMSLSDISMKKFLAIHTPSIVTLTECRNF